MSTILKGLSLDEVKKIIEKLDEIQSDGSVVIDTYWEKQKYYYVVTFR